MIMQKFLKRLLWIYGFMIFNGTINLIFHFERFREFNDGGFQAWAIFILTFIVLGFIITSIVSLVMFVWRVVFKRG